MILITGSAGFIGSNLCYALVDQGYDVIGIDKISPESNRSWTIPLEQKKQMVFEKIDLVDQFAVNSIFKTYPITKIVHLAAESHVDRSISDPGGFWKSNVIGTHNLMAAALEANIELFINQITDEVYGEKPVGEAFEEDKFNPTSPYSCSKASQYWVGHSYFTTYQLPVISTFPVNCFGPRQYQEKVIPKFINKLLVLDQPVPLMASTHFQRDWLPVHSMCTALRLLLNTGIAGEDYNIGADSHKTNQEITEALLFHCDNKSVDKYIKIIPDRLAHDCRYAVNCDKIKNLGWTIGESFNDYLKFTVDWYRKEWEGSIKRRG